MQGSQDFDAYQSDPEDGKRACGRNSCGPEMLETWLLLEFCGQVSSLLCMGLPGLLTLL